MNPMNIRFSPTQFRLLKRGIAYAIEWEKSVADAYNLAPYAMSKEMYKKREHFLRSAKRFEKLLEYIRGKETKVPVVEGGQILQ